MTPISRIVTIAACLGVLFVAGPVAAQPSQSPPAPPDNSNVSFDSPLLVKKKSKNEAPEVKAQPLAWPRLDAGSVLCRSEEDLTRLAARRTGQSANGNVDCKIIRLATPITIVERKGPGRTEVTTTDPAAGGPGWTDAWLPTKAPTVVVPQVRR
jgi:hypothetical protein